MRNQLMVVVAAALTARADVFVTDKSFESTVSEYRSMAATFGRAFPENGVSGRAVMVNPPDGCNPIDPPPSKSLNSGQMVALTDDTYLDILENEFSAAFDHNQPAQGVKDTPPSDAAATRWIAMIARYGGCNFEHKVRQATLANYSAVIVYNVGSNELVPMAGSDDALIPSVFMGGDDAQVLLAKYTCPGRPDLGIVVTDDHPFDINAYLLPFAIVVGICFVIMLVIVVYKCVQDYRRSRRHRLPKSALKKLPIHKFKQGDPFETCCICLDDFEEGDKLRILPCDHGYHAKCIDPWLVKTKRICPQCRKRVFESNERGAGLISVSTSEDAPGSDSDSDYARNSQAASAAAASANANTSSEREPLLPSSRRAPGARYTQRERRNFRRNHQRRINSSQLVRNSNSAPAVGVQDSVVAATPPAAAGPPERGTEHPAGSTIRLSTQERIRRAFVLRGRPGSPAQAPIIQQQDIVSSEEYGETSDDERPSGAVGGSGARVVTTNQEAVTVRIEQPASSGGSSSRRSHQLVAEVHVVPANSEVIVGDPREEPRELPREHRPSQSEVAVVIHPDDDDDVIQGAAAAAAPPRTSPNRKKSKRNVENV